MKKIVLLLATILLLSGMVYAGGGGDASANPPGIVLSSPVLFENGEWNSELGEVTAALRDGTAADASFENGVYKATNGAMWSFVFENSVDARAYRRLIIEIEETEQQLGWWAGGQIWCFHEPGLIGEEGEETQISMFGYWDDIKASGKRLIMPFGSPTKQDQGQRLRLDAGNIIGFTAKTISNMTIVKVYFD